MSRSRGDVLALVVRQRRCRPELRPTPAPAMPKKATMNKRRASVQVENFQMAAIATPAQVKQQEMAAIQAQLDALEAASKAVSEVRPTAAAAAAAGPAQAPTTPTRRPRLALPLTTPAASCPCVDRRRGVQGHQGRLLHLPADAAAEAAAPRARGVPSCRAEG